MYELKLTQDQMQALAGLLDVAVKTLGLRAITADVLGVVTAIMEAKPLPVVEEDPNG